MKYILLALVLSAFGTQVTASEFSFSFSWQGLKLCTSGQPNVVFNPPFTLRHVPDGTTWIQFRLKDRDVPGYNHGGGWVQYTGQSGIARDQFKYKSPCPPNGKHTYEWTAIAKTAKRGGETLGKAVSRMRYPE
jgi:phosphatidylethanolamine-binding protein (PEBP) family uncharacterized protein